MDGNHIRAPPLVAFKSARLDKLRIEIPFFHDMGKKCPFPLPILCRQVSSSLECTGPEHLC